MRVLSCLLLSSGAVATAAADEWQSLRDGIDAWAALDFDANFAVNVGTADGEKFLCVSSRLVVCLLACLFVCWLVLPVLYFASSIRCNCDTHTIRRLC